MRRLVYRAPLIGSLSSWLHLFKIKELADTKTIVLGLEWKMLLLYVPANNLTISEDL